MSTLKSAASKSKISLIFIMLLILSVGINLLLSLRVSTLNRTIESLEWGNDLHIGTTVPPIQGRLLGGGPGDVDFAKAKVPTVLYIFRADCSWCQKNLDNLRALIAASGPRYMIVGLSMSSATMSSSYLQMTHLRFPVYTDISEASIQAYELGGTPETIIVSRDSKVLAVWLGAYQGRMLKDIEDHLGVRLQECCQTPVKGS